MSSRDSPRGIYLFWTIVASNKFMGCHKIESCFPVLKMNYVILRSVILYGLTRTSEVY